MENPYEEAHWGSFTKQWKNRKAEYKNYDTLEKFADFILANPSKFNKISKQRSHFYKNLIKRKGGMFKKNTITKLKEEFNELWNRKIRILQGLSDYILDKIEDSRGLLQASQLYDDYKNAATEVLRQSRDLIRQLNNLKRDVLETDGMTEENKKTLILNKIGKLRQLSEEIDSVKSEYDDIWKSIVPRARMTNRMGESVTALSYDLPDDLPNDLPEKLLRENRATPTTSSISPSVEVPIMARSHLYNLPIDELITALRAQNEKNHDNTILELIHELDDIRSSSSNVPREQRVNDALKRYGFGRPKKGMKITKKCEAMYGGQMTRDLYNYHRQIGGKMSVSQFQKFLTNSYSKKPEQKIDDFEYDPELSIDRAKVYHDPKTGQAVITHTGTDSATDWLNNLAIATNTYKYTSRYKNAKKAQEATEKKYGKQNVSTTGHSQGARLAEKLGKESKEILTLNKATNPFEQYSSKNQTDVRSSGDWVSSLNPLGWMEKNKKVVIPKQSNNIIKEHSPDVLSRIDPNMMIGEGRKRRNKKLKRLCNCCGAKCPYCR